MVSVSGTDRGAIHVLGLDQTLALEAEIGGLDEAGLGVDGDRADDQADRHRELADDEGVAQPAGALGLRRRLVRLEHRRRLKSDR